MLILRCQRKNCKKKVYKFNGNTCRCYSYDAMQCLLHSSSDDSSSCLLGGKHTACGAFKCLLTIGKTCSNGHEAKLNGNECGKSLVCGETG